MSGFEESACYGCGEKCCSRFFIVLEGVKDEDWVRWLSFHQGVVVKKLKKHKYEVWFDLPCRNVRDDGSCSIYEDRPRVCRSFTCGPSGPVRP